MEREIRMRESDGGQNQMPTDRINCLRKTGSQNVRSSDGLCIVGEAKYLEYGCAP